MHGICKTDRYRLTITEEAKNYIANRGYDTQFGARPLKRAIQKYLEDELAEMIINASVLSAIEKMPPWIPAKKNGKIIKSHETLVVRLAP